ncbi:hypothetical protein D3C85_1931840 [compost metagenome]
MLLQHAQIRRSGIVMANICRYIPFAQQLLVLLLSAVHDEAQIVESFLGRQSSLIRNPLPEQYQP